MSCSCGDLYSAENFFLGRDCRSRPISCSTLAAPACSFPSPRGGCRAVRAMHWRIFVGSYVNCIVVVTFPCSCGGSCSAGFFCRSLIVKRGCCSCPIPCSALAEPACSCPSPRGGCRADPVMCWSLSFGFFLGCVSCRVVVVAWGVDSRRGCGLLLPACSFPSPRGWYRASRALHSCGTCPIFVASSCCSVGVVTWGVGFHGGGGVCPPWIKLMCDVPMVPVVRSAAVVSLG